MKRNWIILLMLTILILSGCSTHNNSTEFSVEVSEKEKEFKALYPNIDMNNAINLSEDTQQIDQKHGVIRIGITNTSNHRICFPVGSNVSILSFEEAREWKELNNLTTYIYVKDVVLEPSGDIRDFNNIMVHPVLENNAHQISEMRIVIWGEVCDGLSKGEKEGAYIDVTIERCFPW